jgi:hypothetical protein
MILKLTDAQAIDPNITQGDLDAFEIAVRKITNNNFQNIQARGSRLILSGQLITIEIGTTKGIRVGDTIEINDTMYNDGLYVVASMQEKSITVEGPRSFIDEVAKIGIVTLVNYPADIIKGVKQLIEYDLKMRDKIGIKSETIARMSVTYYDMTATENAEGYPIALLSFLKKYKKMRW